MKKTPNFASHWALAPVPCVSDVNQRHVTRNDWKNMWSILPVRKQNIYTYSISVIKIHSAQCNIRSRYSQRYIYVKYSMPCLLMASWRTYLIDVGWRIYASLNWAINVFSNGSSTVYCQAITWTNENFFKLNTKALGTSFSVNRKEIQKYSLVQMHLINVVCEMAAFFSRGLRYFIIFITSTAECKTDRSGCSWSSCNDSDVHLALCSRHEYTVIHWKQKEPCDRNNTPRFVVIEITRPYPKSIMFTPVCLFEIKMGLVVSWRYGFSAWAHEVCLKCIGRQCMTLHVIKPH